MNKHKCCKHCHHQGKKQGHKYPCNLCLVESFPKGPVGLEKA